MDKIFFRSAFALGFGSDNNQAFSWKNTIYIWVNLVRDWDHGRQRVVAIWRKTVSLAFLASVSKQSWKWAFELHQGVKRIINSNNSNQLTNNKLFNLLCSAWEDEAYLLVDFNNMTQKQWITITKAEKKTFLRCAWAEAAYLLVDFLAADFPFVAELRNHTCEGFSQFWHLNLKCQHFSGAEHLLYNSSNFTISSLAKSPIYHHHHHPWSPSIITIHHHHPSPSPSPSPSIITIHHNHPSSPSPSPSSPPPTVSISPDPTKGSSRRSRTRRRQCSAVHETLQTMTWENSK